MVAKWLLLPTIIVVLQVLCYNDHTEFAALSTTAIIPCGSSENPFPGDAFLLSWYKTDQQLFTQDIFSVVLSTGDVNYENVHSAEKYEYDIRTKAMKIKDIQNGDEMLYNCKAIGSWRNYVFIVNLILAVPHAVEIRQSLSRSVLEHDALTLTCDAYGGKPSSVLSYQWTFVPRYEVSRDLGEDANRELEFPSVKDYHAGVYSCEATNAGGSGLATREILVHYSPKDVSSDNQRVIHTHVQGSAVLNCTVRSYPVITKDDVAIDHANSHISNVTVQLITVDNNVDEVIIQLSFDQISADDFGFYKIILQNGVADATVIEMSIHEQVLPDAPQSLTVESITAVSITVSWITGRSGGASQAFSVYYRNDQESNINFNSDIADPGHGSRVTFTIVDLRPMTAYFVSVRAVNIYGKSDEQDELPITTLDVPDVAGSLTAELYPGITVLYWPNITGFYTEIILWKCTQPATQCDDIFTTHTAPSHFVLKESSQDVDYYLAVLQENQEVSRAMFQFIDNIVLLEKTTDTGLLIVTSEKTTDTGLLSGLIVLAIATFVLALVIIIYVVYRNRHSICNPKGRPSETIQDPVYYNTRPSTSETDQYEATKPYVWKPPSEYAEIKIITHEDLGPST